MKATGERAQQRRHDVERQTAEQHRPAAEAIGQQSPKKLAHAHPRHVGGDDPLAMVLVDYAERPNDRRERRQHRVDGERLRRHHRRHEDDEFGEP